MTREELKGRQTPGTWVGYDPGMVWCKDDKAQVADTRGVEGSFFAPCEVRGQRERHANAVLIAEAGTVANRTGMWPEDLVARVRELEEALAMAPGVRSHNEQGVPIRYEGICTDESGCGCKQSQEIAHIRAILNKKPV